MAHGSSHVLMDVQLLRVKDVALFRQKEAGHALKKQKAQKVYQQLKFQSAFVELSGMKCTQPKRRKLYATNKKWETVVNKKLDPLLLRTISSIVSKTKFPPLPQFTLHFLLQLRMPSCPMLSNTQQLVCECIGRIRSRLTSCARLKVKLSYSAINNHPHNELEPFLKHAHNERMMKATIILGPQAVCIVITLVPCV